MLPQPASPTLTNPDMVLPEHMSDTASLVSVPQVTRPPSPSYLIQQRRTSRQMDTPEGRPKAIRGAKSRMTSRLSMTPEGEPFPARRLQNRHSDVALGSSPTVGMSPAMRTRLMDDGRRMSVSASSITSEDLYAMRIPGFDGLDDDTETITDADLEVSPQAQGLRVGQKTDSPNTGKSAATLMRAELILANAKKRLNVCLSRFVPCTLQPMLTYA